MSAEERHRVLLAGIGNIFLGDDGFGVEVISRIDRSALPGGADLADYGIRGVHLAYELLDGRYDTLIMIDAIPVSGPPGTLAVLDVDMNDVRQGGQLATPVIDGHSLHPQAVLELLGALSGAVSPGGIVRRVLVVGCRPQVVDEVMGLSEPVRAAVDKAVLLVTDLAWAEVAGGADGPARSADGAASDAGSAGTHHEADEEMRSMPSA